MNKYDQQLTEPNRRHMLAARYGTYYHTFERGRALGYRKRTTAPGIWKARIQSGYRRYRSSYIAHADDLQPPNGKDILSFEQALLKAREWCRHPAQSRMAPDPRPTGEVSELIACPCGPVYTVGHALADYVEWKRTFTAESTFQALLPVLNLYVYPRLGTIAADELTADDIRKMLDYVISTPSVAYLRRWGATFDPARMDAETRRRRRHTANHVLSILKRAMDHAWEEGKLADDRAWRRVPNFKGVKRTRVELLTRSECIHLVMACEPGIRTVVLGLLYTGCRISELLDMRAEDVSRVRMAVHVRKSKFYSSRYIALPEEGYRFFKSLSFSRDRRSLIFLRPGGQAWSRYCLVKGLKKALSRAGLPQSVVFHTLRHTYASLRLQEGVSPVAVARQMGHRDVRTVLQIYAHCTDDFIDEEIRKRFVPMLEHDADLSALIEKDCEPVKTARIARKPLQAAFFRRTAR